MDKLNEIGMHCTRCGLATRMIQSAEWYMSAEPHQSMLQRGNAN